MPKSPSKNKTYKALIEVTWEGSEKCTNKFFEDAVRMWLFSHPSETQRWRIGTYSSPRQPYPILKTIKIITSRPWYKKIKVEDRTKKIVTKYASLGGNRVAASGFGE